MNSPAAVRQTLLEFRYPVRDAKTVRTAGYAIAALLATLLMWLDASRPTRHEHER